MLPKLVFTPMNRTAAIITVHNRRELTLACLRSLLRTQEDLDSPVDAYVTDDGSDDGTAEAIAAEFPEVIVLPGDGSLYWVGGMRLAFARAERHGYDHYLLLNDDTLLHPGAIAFLLETAAALRARGDWPAIVVGSTTDPRTGTLTYGGVHRTDRRRPLHFELVHPDDPGGEPRACETMNTNCVLVPSEVVDRIGFFDAAYAQAMADYDYGLRARRAGIGVWVAPGAVGTCPRNPPDEVLPFRRELRRLTSVKGGLPPRQWVTFARRWAGPLWPIYAVSPYARRLRSRLLRP